jgi:hypothetical protein
MKKRKRYRNRNTIYCLFRRFCDSREELDRKYITSIRAYLGSILKNLD